jgi:hypothetical protein
MQLDSCFGGMISRHWGLGLGDTNMVILIELGDGITNSSLVDSADDCTSCEAGEKIVSKMNGSLID